jgi:cytochrome c oxidase cbb3-type subunit III
MIAKALRIRQKAVTILFGVVIVLTFTFWCLAGTLPAVVSAADAPASVKESKNPFEANSEEITLGKKIFNERCTDCHADGTGGAGPDLTDDIWIYGGSDAAVFETISFGRKGGMPQWRTELSKDEIWKVVAFIRSIHKK